MLYGYELTTNSCCMGNVRVIREKQYELNDRTKGASNICELYLRFPVISFFDFSKYLQVYTT